MATVKHVSRKVYKKQFDYFGKKYEINLFENYSGYATSINGENVSFLGHTIDLRLLESGKVGYSILSKDGIKSSDIESEITKATQFMEAYLDIKTSQDDFNVEEKMKELGFEIVDDCD